jgi:isopentenyldiphosphate isomerase
MEHFEVFDENGNPTGSIEPRKTVHSNGLWHRTVHIWIYRRNQILLQKRAQSKDSHSGLWDVSAAGHIEVRETPLEAALRELEEELGIHSEENDLLYVDTKRFTLVSQKGDFVDREITSIYLYRWEGSIDELSPHPEEVEDLQFYDIGHLGNLLEDREMKKIFVPHEISYYRWVMELITSIISPRGDR